MSIKPVLLLSGNLSSFRSYVPEMRMKTKYMFLIVNHNITEMKAQNDLKVTLTSKTLTGGIMKMKEKLLCVVNIHNRNLEWVAISSSTGSSQHRGLTRVSCGSCIAGGFFISEPLGKQNMHNRNLTILAIFKVHSSVVLNAFTFLCHHRHQRRNFFLDLFMYYFCLHWVLIAAPGLSPVAESRGSSLVVVRGLLAAVASLTVEKGSRHTGFSRK